MRNAMLATSLVLVAAVAPATAAATPDPPVFEPIPASTVSVTNGTLSYRAGGTFRHLVAIRRAGDGQIVVRDSSLVLARSAECRNVEFVEVRCSGGTRIQVVLNRPDSRVRSKAHLPVAVRVSSR
jgi:hypothetical protein